MYSLYCDTIGYHTYIMTKKFVDCFMLMGTALSLRGGQKLPEMGRPLIREFTTTQVNLSLNIQEIRIFDSHNLGMEMTTLLNQKWVDPRLGANTKTRKMAVAGQIWKPKVVNINGENKLHNNEDTMFWRGFGDEGNVLLSEKIVIETPCTWDYRKFPFDSQICQFKFGSFRFPQDEVMLLWSPNSIHITADINFTEFKIVNISTHLEIELRDSGNFSSAVVQFILKRHPEHYIQCLMAPSFILTLLNYISFWLDLNQRTIRFYLNLTVFAFLLYFYYISVCLIHPCSYLKAVDVFILICKMFSFVTLLETIFVELMCAAEETQFHLKKHACSKEYPKSVFWTEFAMKIIYPVFYVFLLLVYVFTYL